MNGLSLVNLVSNADAIPYFTGVHDSDHQQIGIYPAFLIILIPIFLVPLMFAKCRVYYLG